jgi:phosphatidylglycerol:prolipoprotein diacylglycerol transferase
MRPVLFEVPGLGVALRSYEVCVAFALLLGWVVSLSRAKEDKLPTESMGLAYLLAAVCGVLGARGLWLAQHPEAFTGPLALVQFQAGGMALFGGIFAGGLATWAYVAKEGVPVAAWFDCLGPALLAGMALEGLGAFLAGTDFGLYAPDLAWGVRFPPGSPAQAFQRATMDGVITPESHALPVHPTQLYGVFMSLVGLYFAGRLRRSRVVSGQVAALCFGWFALSRMVVQDSFTARRQSVEIAGIDVNLAAGVFFVVVAVLAHRSLVLRGQRASDPSEHRHWLGGAWTPNSGDHAGPGA